MAKKLLINKKEYSYLYSAKGEMVSITLEGKEFSFPKASLDLVNDGKHFVLNNRDFFIEKISGRKVKAADEGSSLSPMPGKILKVLVSRGDAVKKGDSLLIMEAMKMEHTLKAGKDGIVKSIKHAEGELVDGQVELVELES